MPYLLQAAFWVGVVGTVAAAPLLCILRMERSYLSGAAFQWSAPFVLFVTAALTFMLAYAMLPTSRLRARIAGVLAGAITFFSFSVVAWFVMNAGHGPLTLFPGALQSFVVVFVLAGWIPLGSGWFAGWLVSKLPDTPPAEAA